MIKLTEEQALEIIKETNEDGGYTHKENLIKGQRYVVAMGVQEIILDDLTVRDLMDYVEIANRYNASFGTWLNDDNGKYYLDLSEIYDNKEVALQTAKVRKEIAIYDLKDNKEIKVK